MKIALLGGGGCFSLAYGSVDHPAKEHEDGKATSPYGISKQAFDDYLKTLHRIHQFPMNITELLTYPTNYEHRV